MASHAVEQPHLLHGAAARAPAYERCCCRRPVAPTVGGDHNTSGRGVHSQLSQRFVHEVTQETLLCQLPGVRRGLIVRH